MPGTAQVAPADMHVLVRSDEVSKSRQQRVNRREAVIRERMDRRVGGEDVPFGRKDQQLMSERVRRVLHGVKQAPEISRNLRATAESVNDTVKQIDPVRVERIARDVRGAAGHIEGASNSKLAGAAESLATRKPGKAAVAGLATAAALPVLAAAGVGAAGRRSSKQLIAAANRRNKRNVGVAIGGGLGAGALAGRRRDA